MAKKFSDDDIPMVYYVEEAAEKTGHYPEKTAHYPEAAVKAMKAMKAQAASFSVQDTCCVYSNIIRL